MAVALTVFALLGHGHDSLAPKSALAQAATRTVAAGSFRVEIFGEAGSARVTGAGAVDAIRRHGRLEFRVTEAGFEVSNEMIYDARAVYVRLPLTDRPSGKPWIRLGRDELDDPAEPFDWIGGFGTSHVDDPAGLLAFLRSTSGDVDEVGRELVRGVEATRYRAIVDLERLASQATGPGREALMSELDWRREAGDPTAWPIDVWVGDDGLARRLRIRNRELGEEATVTVEYFDFGAPAEIAFPPEDQVASGEELSALLVERADVEDSGCSAAEPELDGESTSAAQSDEPSSGICVTTILDE